VGNERDRHVHDEKESDRRGGLAFIMMYTSGGQPLTRIGYSL